MDLIHFQAFIAVAEELHFTKAARRLHMSQPPLSKRIRQLEQELGVELFERSTRSVSLTPAGEALLAPARAVVRSVGSARGAARAGDGGELGLVTLAFAGASSRMALPKLAGAVRTTFPGIELVLQGQTYANTALELLHDGALDLGFIRLPNRTKNLEYVVVENEQLICALPSTHPFADREAISLPDLAEEKFVMFPPKSGSSLQAIGLEACMRFGFQPRVAQTAPDSYTVLALVAAGVGVTLTLTSCKDIQQFGVVYRPLVETTPVLQAALAWNPAIASAATLSVVRVAQAIFGPHRDAAPSQPCA